MPHQAPATTGAERHVFVYGTLRRGGSNDITLLAPAPRWVGLAWVAGVLHDFGRYPGIVLGGTGRVVGEVYAIDAALERRLDEIEEVYPQRSDEYRKRTVDVQVEGMRVPCLLYEINPRHVQHARAPEIGHGDWLAHARGDDAD